MPPQMAVTYIKSSSDTDLVRDIRRTLKTSGIRITENAEEATAVLSIEKEQQTKRLLSVAIQAQEYELRYEVTYSVNAKGDGFKLPSRTVSLSRDYLFDTQAVLGKSREEQTLIRDMQRDIARLILLQLQASAKQQ